MKYIIIAFLLTQSLLANDKQNITLGVGSYIQTQPYKDVDTIALASPVIFFDNSILYIRWTRLGVYFLGEKNDDFSWGLSLTGQPRVYGYEASDIAGMNERKTSFEGGLALSAAKDDAHIEITLLTDLFNRHDTWVANAEIGYDFEFSKLSIYPSVFVSYQSSAFTDYYYGVTASEAALRGENVYAPGAGVQLGIQTYIKYPLTKELSALVNLRLDKLSSQATDSTIIDDSTIYSGLASLIYTFTY